MSSNYKQLILFDCDGGRISLFDDKTILSQLPSNCQCYLFWNNNDQKLSSKLKYLENYNQIHCYPVHGGAKNATDGKLIYFLGKLAIDYSFIVIVHGGDGIYEEVVKSVIKDYDKDKIVDKRIIMPISSELKKLFIELQVKNRQHDYTDPKPSDNGPKHLNEAKIIDQLDKRCLLCSKPCNEIIHLHQHFRDKHKLKVKLVCACKLEFEELKEFHRHRKEKQKYIVDKQGIITCLATKESAKLYLDPYPLSLMLESGKTNMCVYYNCYPLICEPAELLEHLRTKHYNDIHIQVQCCNNDIRHSLDDFCDHIGSQHIVVDIKKSVS